MAKVQENLEPTELPTDLETISDEERFLFRKIGLSMKPYLFLGKKRHFNSGHDGSFREKWNIPCDIVFQVGEVSLMVP